MREKGSNKVSVRRAEVSDGGLEGEVETPE